MPKKTTRQAQTHAVRASAGKYLAKVYGGSITYGERKEARRYTPEGAKRAADLYGLEAVKVPA